MLKYNIPKLAFTTLKHVFSVIYHFSIHVTSKQITKNPGELTESRIKGERDTNKRKAKVTCVACNV